MTAATGLILFGGPHDGREINTARELAHANANVTPHGTYVQTERRNRAGRLILAYTPARKESK